MDFSSTRKLAQGALDWTKKTKPERATSNGERLAYAAGAAALAVSSVLGVAQGVSGSQDGAASSSTTVDQFEGSGPQPSPSASQSAAPTKSPAPKPTEAAKPAKPKSACEAFPTVVDMPSPNFNSRGGTDIDSIILHHTASNNFEQDLRTLTDPAAQVSAHLLIPREPLPGGDMAQLVNYEDRAWHAGEGVINGDFADVNNRSIGIEIVNAGDGTPYTEHQMKVLDIVVPCLSLETFDIPKDQIKGHKDIDIPDGRKIDPANFDWDRLFASYDSYAKAMGKE